MDTNEIREKLNDLMHLDVDAVNAYREAIERIRDADIGMHLQEYMRDHQRHVDELRLLVTGLGGEPEEAKPDIKGFLIKGMTQLRSSMSDEQALKAMHQNEEVTTRAYRDAVGWTDVPDDVREVLARAYRDEQRHIAYIEERLHALSPSMSR
jgi:uncharacterized protein (TIGR02284 family)